MPLPLPEPQQEVSTRPYNDCVTVHHSTIKGLSHRKGGGLHIPAK